MKFTKKNEQTIYLSLDISHLQLLRSCFHAVTCLYRSKNPNLYPLTYDFAKMHSAKAAVAVCSPQRTPTSGRFLMDSPSRGSVSWAFTKFGCGYYVWIDLALNLLQSSGFSIQSLNSSTQNEFFFTNGAWNSVGLATYALNASILFSHGAKERIRILQSTTHAHGMCFTSNVWMVGFVKGVAYAKWCNKYEE